MAKFASFATRSDYGRTTRSDHEIKSDYKDRSVKRGRK